MLSNDDLDALETLGWDTHEERLPAPSEHAPRKAARRTGVGFLIHEERDADAWIASQTPVPVER